jgi:hypothetical protein
MLIASEDNVLAEGLAPNTVLMVESGLICRTFACVGREKQWPIMW